MFFVIPSYNAAAVRNSFPIVWTCGGECSVTNVRSLIGSKIKTKHIPGSLKTKRILFFS